MKLTLPGTRRIEGGEIELDGITVLCGCDNTANREVCEQIMTVVGGAFITPMFYLDWFCKTMKAKERPPIVGWLYPEEREHPKRQVEIAKTICRRCCRPESRVVLVTHSVYVLRAIEVFSERCGIQKRCHYYKTEPVEGKKNVFRLRNVDGETNLIYYDFYTPLEEL